MNLASLSKMTCFVGLACFVSGPLLGGINEILYYMHAPNIVHFPVAVVGASAVFLWLLATCLLWILDWIILTRTWTTRDGLFNFACIIFLVIANMFAAYILYFVFRKSLTDEYHQPA